MGKEQMVFPFALASDAGPYDEAQVLSDDLDIQLTLSRSAVAQPFHLICQHDTTLVVLYDTPASNDPAYFTIPSIVSYSVPVNDYRTR